MLTHNLELIRSSQGISHVSSLKTVDVAGTISVPIIWALMRLGIQTVMCVCVRCGCDVPGMILFQTYLYT
jgi:hypothetical protein